MRDNKLINKLISRIKTRSALMRRDIQDALVECALFALEDRNTDPAIRLFTAVGNDANKRAMSHWLSTNACIHFKDEKPVLADKKQKDMAAWTAEDKAKYVRDITVVLPKWFEYATQSNTATNVWDGDAALEKMREYLDAYSKKAKKANDVEVLAAINAMSADLTKAIDAKAAAKAAKESEPAGEETDAEAGA